jgi:hypothetical protein
MLCLNLNISSIVNDLSNLSTIILLIGQSHDLIYLLILRSINFHVNHIFLWKKWFLSLFTSIIYIMVTLDWNITFFCEKNAFWVCVNQTFILWSHNMMVDKLLRSFTIDEIFKFKHTNVPFFYFFYFCS